MYRSNQLKRLLLDGGKALGCWSYLDGTVATEVAAMAGFDFLLIDQEHGSGSPEQLTRQLQAMSATATTSVVRVPSHDAGYTKRVLDAGAECIMFPVVNTASQAGAIVDGCRFPPVGSRGLAAGVVRAAEYGYKRQEYVQTANDNVFVICQIETREAVDNVEELLAVDGVDLWFVGPNDLAASIGKIGQFEDAEFVELIGRARTAVLDAGKLLGVLPYGAFSWQDMFDQGCHLTTAGSDLSFLRTACVDLVAQHRANNQKNT